MKIAIVFDGLGYGGIERVGIDYIVMMKDLGYDVDVYNLSPKYNELEKEIVNICNVIHCNFPHKLCPELYSFGVKKWWWGKYLYPNIVLLLTPLLKIRKIFKNYKKKYDIVISFSGHINDLTFVGNNFLKSNKKLCWLHGSLADYLLICSGFGQLYMKIGNLCVLSEYAQEIALNGNKFMKEIKIHKIYNPTSIKNKSLSVKKIQELENNYGNYLLMIGRFTKQKDQATVIRAMKLLVDGYNISNKMVFVGDGEERFEMEKLVKKLKLEDVVVFEGSRLDVQNYYEAAYLFIHSSPAEGLPTVLLEAMSFRLPVVATNSLPGVQEILNNGEYGLICPVYDEKLMAKQIYRLITEEKIYTHYQNQCDIRIKEFSPENISLILKNILENLV